MNYPEQRSLNALLTNGHATTLDVVDAAVTRLLTRPTVACSSVWVKLQELRGHVRRLQRKGRLSVDLRTRRLWARCQLKLRNVAFVDYLTSSPKVARIDTSQYEVVQRYDGYHLVVYGLPVPLSRRTTVRFSPIISFVAMKRYPDYFLNTLSLLRGRMGCSDEVWYCD